MMTCKLSSFLKHPSPTVIYTLSLHDALPIFRPMDAGRHWLGNRRLYRSLPTIWIHGSFTPSSKSHLATMEQRSEEHTSELQSRLHLVCRLLLEKKKQPTK